MGVTVDSNTVNVLTGGEQTREGFAPGAGRVTAAWRFPVAAWLAFLLIAASPADAQLFNEGGLFNRKPEAPRAQTEDEIGVPVPVTGRVEALKGHEVTFEIRAESKTPGATVEFLIRAFPSAGRIVSLVSKPNERNKAIVTYWADPASSAPKDAFSFAVRYRGGRYSSEMRYDIDLVDLKTEIQVPESIDFGEVTVGREEVRELTVRNLGNGTMERQIFLAPPWHLLDPADGKLNLGPRGGRVLKIAFRPELTGETSYFLSFSRTKEGTTKLIGRGAEAFQIVTEAIELTLDEATGERLGVIELNNPGTKSISVQARATTRLEGSLLKDGYLLAPGQVTKVKVKLAASDTAPLDGTVEFFLKGGYAKPVRVIAPVVPARLVVSVPGSLSAEVINFGQVQAGRSVERGITITNRGGVAVPLEFHLPEPFRLLTNPGPQLGPLSAVDLSIGLFPTATRRGPVDVTMNIMGESQTVPIRLLGNVVAPAAGGAAAPEAGPVRTVKSFRLGTGGAKEPEITGLAPTDTGLPEVPPGSATVGNGAAANPAGSGEEGIDWHDGLSETELAAARSPLGFVTRSLVERKVDPTLRKPEDLAVFEKSSDSLVLGWTAPRDGQTAQYELEVRAMIVNETTGEPESVWVPFPVAEIETIDRLVKARVEGLFPAAQYEMRVVLTTPGGTSSPPSDAIVAMTDLPMDWTYIYLALGILFLIALAFGAWRVYLARRPEVYQAQYVDV
jgi:hypothetical protein